jgi:hypothetical protein
MGNNNAEEKLNKNPKSNLQKTIQDLLKRAGEDFQGFLEGLNPGRKPIPLPIPIPAPVYRRRRR